MQFFGKRGKNYMFAPLLEGWHPSYGNPGSAPDNVTSLAHIVRANRLMDWGRGERQMRKHFSRMHTAMEWNRNCNASIELPPADISSRVTS